LVQCLRLNSIVLITEVKEIDLVQRLVLYCIAC
jgi:hypothetical protein